MQVFNCAVVDSLATIYIAYLAIVATLESSHVGSMSLDHILSVEQNVVHSAHHATTLGVCTCCSHHSTIEVSRAISANTSTWAHRTYQYHRFVAVNGQIQEVSSLFHGVGSVSHHYAVVTLVVQQLVNSLSQFQPHLVVHILRTNIYELLA